MLGNLKKNIKKSKTAFSLPPKALKCRSLGQGKRIPRIRRIVANLWYEAFRVVFQTITSRIPSVVESIIRGKRQDLCRVFFCWKR